MESLGSWIRCCDVQWRFLDPKSKQKGAGVPIMDMANRWLIEG